MTLFAFDPDINGNEAVLEGFKQQYLSMISPYVVRVELLKRQWRDDYETELELLNTIGSAMSLVLTEPQQSLIRILEAMRDYFKVNAISLNDLIPVKQGDIERTELHIRDGIGYNTAYKKETWIIGDPTREGRSGYIAREQQTLASWYDENNNRKNFKVDSDSGILIPIHGSILSTNRRYCFEDPNEELMAFLGAPILFRSREKEQERVIGVLKMANRRSGKQRFNEREAISAMRIAKLLGPFLLMLQNSSRFGLEDQMKSMIALFRGIRHELERPLANLGFACNNLQLVISPDHNEIFQAIENYKLECVDIIESLNRLVNHDLGKPIGLSLHDVADARWDRIYSDISDQQEVQFLNKISKTAGVMIDPSHLDRILDNLFANALEAVTDCDIPEIQVNIQNEAGNLLTFSVIDNGSGIPETIHQRLFDPFVSGHSSPIRKGRPGKVRGLGLTIVRMATASAGGDVKPKLMPSGARFDVSLPNCSPI